MIVVSLDKKHGDGGSFIATEVVEFDNKDLVDAACSAVAKRDEQETYTQVEAFKLYGGLP